MSKKPTISPMKNGPFLLKGIDSLVDAESNSNQIKESGVILCRCGKSGKKPFCDGTHSRESWEDTNKEPTKPQKTRDYVGKNITIHDKSYACSKAGNCVAGSPKVFDPKRKPWIEPDAEAAEKIIETIRKCPSGALSYSVDGVLYNNYSDEPEIKVTKNGPYEVKGAIKLEGDAKPAVEEHYCLCRCGDSNNKPFCDSTHLKSGFKDNGLIKE